MMEQLSIHPSHEIEAKSAAVISQQRFFDLVNPHRLDQTRRSQSALEILVMLVTPPETHGESFQGLSFLLPLTAALELLVGT